MTAAGWLPDIWSFFLGLSAGLACGFLNTAASSGSAVSLPILMMIGLDPIAANATNRIPVLIGAISATASFYKRGALPLGMAAKVSLPVAIGGLLGARFAEILPARDLGLVITAAVLLALVLLFTKLKQIIQSAASGTTRYGPREFLIFLLIGLWLGFIVLDGATYLLLALTLAVGLPLVYANGVKNAVLIPATAVAILVFAYQGSVDWALGAVMGAGSILGGILGARLATSARSGRWVGRLLILVISAEFVHLLIHYAFKTA